MLACITMLEVKEVTLSSCNVSLLFSLLPFRRDPVPQMLGTVCSRAACHSWIIFLNDCSETYWFWIRKRDKGCGKGKKVENLEKEEILSSISRDISACQRSRGQACGWGKQGYLLLPGSIQEGGHAPKRKSCMSQADCWDTRALTVAPQLRWSLEGAEYTRPEKLHGLEMTYLLVISKRGLLTLFSWFFIWPKAVRGMNQSLLVRKPENDLKVSCNAERWALNKSELIYL